MSARNLCFYRKKAAHGLAARSLRSETPGLLLVLRSSQIILWRKSDFLQSRFPVDCVACFYSFCCVRLLSSKLLVQQHRGSSNHFSCRIKIKEDRFFLISLEPRNGRALVAAKFKLDWMLPLIFQFTRPSRLCDFLGLKSRTKNVSVQEAKRKKAAY